MREYETRITRLTVLPKDEPIFSEMATDVEIEDEAAGEFVKVTQHDGSVKTEKSILINPEEWPYIKAAIDQLLSYCKNH
jgi:hypothetical protein